MQLRRTPASTRQVALQTVAGEPGCAALIVVLIAGGVGMLIDFQVTHLHPAFSVALFLGSVPFALYWALRRTIKMDRNPQAQYVRNLTLAAIAGQAGCSSVVMIFLALFAGLFLDAKFDTHPVLTIGLVLIAIPVSLYVMVRLLLSSVGAIQTAPPGTRQAPGSSPTTAKSSGTKENET
ncbi:MAG TPA: AtpZ/AtpI family protein [Aggregatilinea sp.]|uniref:AtpZ/AtpI family protein n=1 Tax=Aggregatilinea sp. TaxID=2806333 RepID=UPI002CDA88BC|nr:AtpZ/AtpI family protein [Aggregatilinea sp.]HML24328.1 AtpZ/AtpI family protein [Aggregatilinea sp.]